MMSSKYEALPRDTLGEVVRVYRSNLEIWLDKCSAALAAMRYLEKIHGEDAKQEVAIALRYAQATKDAEAIDAFEIIVTCLEREELQQNRH